MALSKDLGGLGVSAEAQMRIMEEIAYGDGSTAVALNMHVLIADFLNFFPPFPRRNAVLEDIGRTARSSAAAPRCRAAKWTAARPATAVTEDGDNLVVNGKAGFASMSEGAKYTIIGGAIDRGEGNAPDVCVMIPEIATPGIRIMYNWDAMGLRGTASHDVVAENVLRPEGRGAGDPAGDAARDHGGAGAGDEPGDAEPRTRRARHPRHLAGTERRRRSTSPWIT